VLPKIRFEKETFKAAGIAGSLDLPAMGNVMPMQCTVSFHADSITSLQLSQRDGQGTGTTQLRCMASIANWDTSSGQFNEQPEEIVMKVYASEFDLGKREPDAKGLISIVFDVPYIAVYFNSIKYFESDPANNRCLLNGVDLNQQTRANLS
jgi:phage tail tube protein FII